LIRDFEKYITLLSALRHTFQGIDGLLGNPSARNNAKYTTQAYLQAGA